MMNNKSSLENLQNELSGMFIQLSELQNKIIQKLKLYADGKMLKGNEIVGCLGEIYGKILLGGRLVDDSKEHDILTQENDRISVKTRKGWNSGWKQTSAIPSIEGDSCPTHLLFVHLNNDYSLDRIWLYEWDYLLKNGRFTSHVVRGKHRSYIFKLDNKKDDKFIVFKSLRM